MKKNNLISLLLPALLMLGLAACGGNEAVAETSNRPVYIAPGVGLGTIIAVVISWSRNKSVLWAIIHGILGWLYVIYAVIVGKK